MKRSESIKNLAVSLNKAQALIDVAGFDKVNPHFKNRYASLGAVWSAIRKPLQDNGLSVSQGFSGNEIGCTCITTLMHTSGEWIEFEFPMILDKQNMQGFGSAATYARRYSLAALLGVVSDEDDDGEAAVDVKKSATKGPIEKVRAVQSAVEADPGEYVCTFGKWKGQKLKDIDVYDIVGYVSYIEQSAESSGKPITGQVLTFMNAALEYIKTRMTPTALEEIKNG